MADVSVYDGSKWVSIAGEDGADGKSVEFPVPPSAATNVPNIDDNTPGNATLDLELNVGASDETKNVYDVTIGVPVGIRGPQGPKGDNGEDGTGVNILGQLQNPPGTPVVGPPTQDNTQGHDICTDGAGSAWLDKDGDLWVWVEQTGDCAGGTPPTYNNVGSIQGPAGAKGDGWKSEGTGYDAGTGKVTFASDDGLEFTTGDLRGADASISLNTTVPVTFKTDCSAGGSGSFTDEGSDTWKLALTMPRGQHVYTGAATGSGENIKPDDQTGDFSTACTGDIWVLS